VLAEGVKTYGEGNWAKILQANPRVFQVCTSALPPAHDLFRPPPPPPPPPSA
jgi:hypothetical protein